MFALLFQQYTRQEKENVFHFDSTWRCHNRISFSENHNCVRSAFQSTTQSFLRSLFPRLQRDSQELKQGQCLLWVFQHCHGYPTLQATLPPQPTPLPHHSPREQTKKQKGRGEGVSLPYWSLICSERWNLREVTGSTNLCLSALAEGWGHVMTVQIQSHL